MAGSKKKRRVPPKSSAMLTPGELDLVFVIPRFHLELLLNGTAEPRNLKSIGGLLNIGTGLAEVRQDAQLLDEVQSALVLLLDAALCNPPKLAEDKTAVFLALTHKIEAIARRTPRHRFVEAINYVAQAPETHWVSPGSSRIPPQE